MTAGSEPRPGPLHPLVRTGLRERKKRRTYETISRVALDLFAAQGFRATTIAQIAEKADVSPRTVSSYFPVKEDLIFGYDEQGLAGLGARLRDRPADEYAVDALRAWIGERFGELRDADARARERVRRRVIESDEVLRARARRHLEPVELLLRDAIARDLGTTGDDVAAQLASAAAVGALLAIGRFHDERCEIDDPVAHRDAALAVVDQAIVFLRGGVRELRAHRGEPPLGTELDPVADA